MAESRNVADKATSSPKRGTYRGSAPRAFSPVGSPTARCCRSPDPLSGVWVRSSRSSRWIGVVRPQLRVSRRERCDREPGRALVRAAPFLLQLEHLGERDRLQSDVRGAGQKVGDVGAYRYSHSWMFQSAEPFGSVIRGPVTPFATACALSFQYRLMLTQSSVRILTI